MGTIAFYVGANTHFNVTRTIDNNGWMLSNGFELDLITTSPEAYDPASSSYYNIFGDQYSPDIKGHFLSLWSYLNSNDPDIFIPATRPVLYGLIGTPFFLKNNNMKYIFRHSGEIFDYYKCLQGAKKWMVYVIRNIGGKINLYTADYYITLGPKGEKNLRCQGVDPELIEILHPTIAETRFAGQKELPKELEPYRDRKIILFIGRMTYMKGIDWMERVIPEILSEHNNFQFVFVGEDDYSLDIPTQMSDHVTVCGPVDPQSIPSYLLHSDLLVLPSRSEGVPRVLLESLFMQTPVLARDVGDVSTVTQNTISNYQDFKENIIFHDELSVDPVDRFLRSEAKDDYLRFFNRLVN